VSRKRRLRRYLLVGIVLLAIIGGLGAIKACQIGRLVAFGEQMEQAGPPPETVGTTIAEAASWPVELSAIGTVTGRESVAIATETAGIVTKLGFDSGDQVRRGQMMVELESSSERAQLASAQARLELARVTVARSRALVADGAVPRAQLDQDETQLTAAENEVKALQTTLEHKVVTAPFAGRVGIREVKLGQYLAVGATVTTIDGGGVIFVDFSLPQEQLGAVHVGTPVRVAVRGQEPFDGTITAIDPAVDPATRSLALRASVSKHRGALRSGMFVDVTVVLPARQDVVVAPETAIVHAPYGDSVFVVEDKPPDAPGMRQTPEGKPVKIARQQFVRLGPARGDFIAVVEGLTANQVIVSAGGFKLRNGSPIVIDNSVTTKPELAPRPENR
jgi:membrane fusion protein (multidrug efflux system)